jgi:hypothetical protein
MDRTTQTARDLPFPRVADGATGCQQGRKDAPPSHWCEPATRKAGASRRPAREVVCCLGCSIRKIALTPPRRDLETRSGWEASPTNPRVPITLEVHDPTVRRSDEGV